MGFLDRFKKSGSVDDKVNSGGKIKPNFLPEHCQAGSRVTEVKYDKNGKILYNNSILICIGTGCGLSINGIGIDPEKCFYREEEKVKDVLKEDCHGREGILSNSGDNYLCNRT